MATSLRKPPPLLVAGSSPDQCSHIRSLPFTCATYDGGAPASSDVEQPYVLHVAPLGSDQGYVFGGSDDSLRVFSSELDPVGQVRTSQRGLTSVVPGSDVASQAGPRVVFTTAKDGTVVGWDSRDWSKEAFKLKNKTGAGYLTASQSSDGSCLAVGAELHNYEATIDFWDLRSMKLSQTYTEAHSDDITCVQFHPSPSLPHVLLSTSVDGLLNTYDVRIADEDDSILSTSQIGTSLVSGGWMALKGQEADPEQKGAWCATTTETMQFWDVNETEQLYDFDDVRDVALQPWRADYLIGAYWDTSLNGVCILTGTTCGEVAINNLSDPSRWVLERIVPSATYGRRLGHIDIVRCAHVDSRTSTMVTGGEDGRVCLWSLA